MTFPVYVDLFGLSVSAHQLLETVAYLAGFRVYLVLRRRWPKAPPLPFIQSSSIVLAAVLGALVGAKLLAWVESYPLYWAHRSDLRVLLGGKTIVGALLGGWLAVEALKRRLGIRQYSGDIYVFPLAVGMSIGRVGCFLHGLADGTYGTATALPWGVDFGDGVRRHPTQLYEVAFLVLVGALLYRWRSSGRHRGCMFSQFMGLYLLFRFVIEFIKPRFTLPGISLSPIQVASLLGIAYAVIRRQDECCVGASRLAPVPPRPAALLPGETRFLELTGSVCSRCLTKVDAKVIEEREGVYLRKFCPEHGIETVLVADDAAYWKACRAVDKAPTPPLRRNTESRLGCPYDCGLCPEHEQHCCLAVVEVTDRCDQGCPVCYASSTPEAPHRTLGEIRMMLDAVVANEGTVGVVQISGGEPTLHPEFFEVLDEVRRRPIRHLMVNTNGRRIAEEPGFAARLAAYMPGLEIYLQFDSLRPHVLTEIRGADYSDIRRRTIDALAQHGVSTTLVVTLKKGTNDQEIGRIIDYALSVPTIRGVTFQPVQAAGRLDRFDSGTHRLTLTEVRRSILAQHGLFLPQDLVPVPCHPDSIAMAYAVRGKDRVVPLSRLIDPSALMALGGNTICYEQEPAVRKHLEALFSAGASPGGAAATISALCCGARSPLGDAAHLDYSQVFRVTIMHFMDAHSMDLRSVKRSCVHIVSRDGRLVPFDTYNLLYRSGQHGTAQYKGDSAVTRPS